ncbi:MAG: putative endonuclease [Sphingobacteriales bacterium]|jgi:putative endonuclease
MATRLEQHNTHFYKTAFTRRASDWVICLQIKGFEHEQSRNVERNIKKMKSVVYLKHLARYPEMQDRLICKYATGSSLSR